MADGNGQLNPICKTECPRRRLFCDIVAKDCLLSPAQIVRLRGDLVRLTRAEYLKRHDEQKRQERIDRDIARPTIFARRRMRRLGLIK